MSNYEDIINLPHFVSRNRKHMSNHDRAAQFAPFAALTGYDEVIRSRDDIYLERQELSEDEIRVLNEILLSLQKGDTVEITYYQDGAYLKKEGAFRLIDTVQNFIDIDRFRIPLSDVIHISRSEK